MLLELGADDANLLPPQVDAARFAGLDELEVEDCAWRIARLALLTLPPADRLAVVRAAAPRAVAYPCRGGSDETLTDDSMKSIAI